MPGGEIDSLYFNDNNYASATRESQWYNVGLSVGSLAFTVFCSENCEFGIRWAVDKNYEAIQEFNRTLTANSSDTMEESVRTRYVQFYVKNIANTPCRLQISGFFFDKFLSKNKKGDTEGQ